MSSADTPSASGEPVSSRYAWYVVAVLTLANLSANIDQTIMTLLVKPMEADFGISDVQISYLNGLAFAVFFAVLGLPIARLADRSNRRTLMAGGVALWSLFTVAGAAARSFGRLFVTRVGVGVGEAALNAPGVSLLADYFPRARLGRAMSIYSLAVFAGSGAGYYIGAWVVGLVSVSGTWTVPVLGEIHPWQSVFLAVGLPGFAIAALFFTIREPVRREALRGSEPLPLSVLVRYVADNRRTFLAQGLGFGCYAVVNFGLAVWLPQFFQRTYGWTASQAGRTQGILTMTLGTAGVVLGGMLSDWFVRRGKVHGPLLVGMLGAAGMLVANTVLPLAPTATLAVMSLALVNVFAALPWGAASAAAAEIVPAPLRAQGAAVYFLILNLVSRTLGPSAVAWITEYGFHDKGAIRYSLAIVNVLGMTAALAIFATGIGAYRRTIEYRERWTAAAS